ncbi:hypothetical protein F4859DRAFT_205009 [Xylaria cf. heliscus]|nr:hypothetical protein F4859DRAFT_205009 [Xylaria cf. heliscus]
MRPSTPSISLLTCLARTNPRQIGHIKNRGHSQEDLTSRLVHYHTIQTCQRQLDRQTRVNLIVYSRRRPCLVHTTPTMPEGIRTTAYKSYWQSKPRRRSHPKKPLKIVHEALPSSSVILLSPTNQVLLLHRVNTSTSFPSAHVFPGGNLSDFHEGTIAPRGDVERHDDCLAYRLAAIRETFEESGILLARHGGENGPLLKLPTSERDRARQIIYDSRISFRRWLESVGGVPDTKGLEPFTRWITPLSMGPKRFTTQMYVYMLPLEGTGSDAVLSAAQDEALIPTPDGGAEVTTALFEDVSTWLEKQVRGEIILFPPQFFLLHLLAPLLTGAPAEADSLGPSETREYYHAQRERLRSFLRDVPTTSHPRAVEHSTSQIPWGDKVISPVVLGSRHDDERVILALDKPGPELSETRRGGDRERVVLAEFKKGGPRKLEVRGREEILGEEKEAKKAARARMKEGDAAVSKL